MKSLKDQIRSERKKKLDDIRVREPLDELLCNGRDLSPDELFTAIVERRKALEYLYYPYVDKFGMWPRTEKESAEEDKVRFRVELEIAQLLMGRKFDDLACDNIKKGIAAGIRFEKKARQNKIESGRHSASRESRKYCIKLAHSLWADQERDADAAIMRTGTMADVLFGELLDRGMYYPESSKQIVAWLQKAAKKGELNIPAAARKRGRTKNTK